MSAVLPAWWVPPALHRYVRGERAGALGGVPVRFADLDPDALVQLSDALRMGAARLARIPVARIVSALDGTAAAWLDDGLPERRAIVQVLATTTGMSQQMVAECIDLEMASSRAPELWAVLRSELGDPAALDGFVSAGRGRRVRARGPGLIGAVFSSNIPALPHLSVMRALLVKSGFLGRSSAAEPLFLPAWLETLHRIDPGVACASAVLAWPRERVEAAFLGGIDRLIGWGGTAAEEHFRSAAPPDVPVHFHGHRLGVAVVTAEGRASLDVGALRVLGDRLALDVTRFDQEACLAPHVVFVEGSIADAVTVAEAIADGMEHLVRRLPPRAHSVSALARLHAERGVDELEVAIVGGRLFVPPDGGAAYTVVGTAADGVPVSPLGRYVRVVPVRGRTDLLDRLRSVQRLLQNVALQAPGADGETLREEIASLGATRLCAPGGMATPSMLWHHDGRACVGELVRWCDEEAADPPA
jgi:hypothetical protein